MDSNTLELVRKTLFGGSAGGVLDFNAAFSSVPQVVGNNFDAMMAALNPGGKGPGTVSSASENAVSTPASQAVANAIGTIAAIGITGVASPVPGMTAAMNAVGVTNNSLSAALATIAAAMGITSISVDATPENRIAALNDSDPGLNGSVGDSAPADNGDGGIGSAAGANNGGGGVTADSGGGDSGDGGATGSASTGDGAGAGANGGPGDSGGGAYFHGGFVPGPSTGEDKVTIQVDGGEVVIPAATVDMLGRNFFEDILLNTKSPAVEFLEKQQKEAEKKAKEASKGNK